MSRTTTFLAFGALCAALSVHAATPPNVQQVAGCYELTLGSWRPSIDLGEDAEFLKPPHAIELRPVHGSVGAEKENFLIRPAPGTKGSIHRLAWWDVKDGKVSLVWTTGFSGLTMKLTPRGADLVGIATSFWDFSRTKQQSRVVAKRITCRRVAETTARAAQAR